MLRSVSKYRSKRRLQRRMEGPEELQPLLTAWMETPLGQETLKAERELVSPVISRLFGYHILQIGCSEDESLLAESPVGNKILFAPKYEENIARPVANTEELPLANNSVDAVLLHHALDFTPNSHKLLREASRVIMPGGRLLVIGFNPYSMWGLSKLMRSRNRVPWKGRFISCRRIVDWLKLLEFHIDNISSGVYFMPLQYERLLQHANNFENVGRKLNSPHVGAVYFIVASKQVIPVTPIQSRWRKLRAPTTIVVPATDNVRAKVN